MKRKDWKIKKLEKDTFGNLKKKKKSKYMLKNIHFLRKLNIKKIRKLKKKNLIMNFIFYKKLKSIYFSKLNNYTNIFLFKSLNSYLEVLPIFFITKKVFLNYNIFCSYLKNKNLDFLFVKNYNNELSQNNSKIIIFKKNEFKCINYNNLFDNNDDLIAIPKTQKNIHEQNFNEIIIFNYYLNYNIFVMNSLEIYKIIINLYMYNILKNK